MSESSTGLLKQRKASLWEKTIVRAFRDLQWHYKGAKHPYPEPSAEFDGKLEQALGDGIVSAGDKLYLLEMKADAAGKRDEWNSDPGKLPYEALKQSLSTQGDHDERSMHVLSMRGHLFLYWEAVAALKRSICRPGALVVSSYLLDLIKAIPAKNEQASELVEKFSLGKKSASIKRRFIPLDQMLAGRLFTPTAVLLEVERGIGASKMALGLTPDEMHQYVSWLVSFQKEKDLRLNALLASRSGSVCQHVISFDELINVIQQLREGNEADSTVDLSGLEKSRLLGGAKNFTIDETQAVPRRTQKPS